MKPSALLIAATLWAAPVHADTSLAPRPAEMMPRAAQSILIDLSRAGDRLVAVGNRGHILLSDDGRRWRQVASPVRAMLNRAHFLDASRGWIVGHDATILATRDGGESWALQHNDAEWGKPLYDLLFLDADNGIAVGANSRILVTADGGASWTEVDHDFQLHGVNLYAIIRLGDGQLLIVGEKAMLARSADKGASWEMLRSPYSGSFFGALPDGAHGALLFGLRGTAYRITDVRAAPVEDVMMWDEFELKFETDPARLAAMHWQYLPNAVTESLFGGSRLADGRALLVGVNGAVVAATGDRLEAVDLGTELTLGDALPHAEQLILVGINGVDRRPLTAAGGTR